MGLKSITDNINEKFSALTKREQMISIITLLLALILIPYLMLLSPLQVKIKTQQQTLETLKKELDSLNQIAALQVTTQKPDTEKFSLPQADDLSGMLASISKEANLARVDFISIAPEGFITKDKFIELKVKIELRVKFRQLYDFLGNIEARHKLFLIQDIKFETNPTVYPSGIAIIKAITYLKGK
ncbi:MAG: type 4a pilus biogenesis protein PilO [Nitrospiraceae bacterium]|nr:type 4a pilus biogenesis protein PilO [Nitrospiraceae bacterium]